MTIDKAGSILRHQKVLRRSRQGIRREIVLVSIVIILASVLLSSPVETSWISTDDSLVIADVAPWVVVELGFIFIRDNDLDWFVKGYSE